MKTVLQIGYGMQGKSVLADLRKNMSISEIIVVDAADSIKDLKKNSLADPRITPIQMDIVADKASLSELMRRSDVVIELMPENLTKYLLRMAVENETNLVSTMYFYNGGEQDEKKRLAEKEEITSLDAQARAKGITVIKEMGMEPGLDFILAYKAVNELNEVRAFHSYGAGFPEPQAADNALRYKFTWSIIGLIHSCYAPCVIIENGRPVTIPADSLFIPSNTHLLKLPEFEEPLECSPCGESDTIAKLFGLEKVNTMGRYITRWPGHNAFWNVMAKTGFLSTQPIKIGNIEISPDIFCIELLSQQEQFYYKKDERDVALLRVDVRGYKNGKPQKVVIQILDYRDINTGFTAMQRTVGFTASIGAQLILDGTLSAKKGIISPSDVPFDRFMDELKKRGIVYTMKLEDWDGNERP